MMPHDAASRVPPWLHHALFVLFLLGVLGYGGSFAFYMLTKFDLINLIRDVNLDDAFYYYEIAKNLAEGKFSTFDGGITRTNGYHPLWMLLITPFYWICDPVTALFGIKAFEIMLVTGAVVLVVLAARVARLPWILLFAALPMLFESSAPHDRDGGGRGALHVGGPLSCLESLRAESHTVEVAAGRHGPSRCRGRVLNTLPYPWRQRGPCA